MKIGASTACLYPLETEKALYELAVRGVENVEIFINSVDELEGGILAEMKSILSAHGMGVTSVHPFSSPMETLFLFGDYPRRTEYLLDIYKRYFEVMNEIGARIFVLHGAILSSKVPDDRYLERYLRLYREGQARGITVVQENVCYCKSRDIAFLKRMSDQLGDEVRFVIDLKQARRSDIDAFELIDALGGKTAHFHLSDGGEKCDCMPIGTGSFDFPRFFAALDRLHYDGALIVELYRENYSSYDDLAHCVTDLERIIRQCAAE